MTRALAYLVKTLRGQKNLNFLDKLAKHQKKSVPNLMMKSDIVIRKENLKLQKLFNKPIRKNTFTDKFYTDKYKLTDDFGKSDWMSYFELSNRYPGLVKTWQGSRFPKSLKFRRTNKEMLSDAVDDMMKKSGIF